MFKFNIKEIFFILFLLPLAVTAESDLDNSAMDLAKALQDSLKENGSLDDFSLSQNNAKPMGKNSSELIKNIPLRQEKYSDWSASDPAFEFVFRKSIEQFLPNSPMWMSGNGPYLNLVRETAPRQCAVKVSAINNDGYVERQQIDFYKVNWKTMKIKMYDDAAIILAECVDNCMFEDRVMIKGLYVGSNKDELEWDNNGFRNSNWYALDRFRLSLADFNEASRYHDALERIAKLCPQSTSAY